MKTAILAHRPPHDAPAIDAFIAYAVDGYRSQLPFVDDVAGRSVIEDAIALLTDYRLYDIDERAFDTLLAGMTRGRSPVAMLRAGAPAVAADLRGRWHAYRRSMAVPS